MLPWAHPGWGPVRSHRLTWKARWGHLPAGLSSPAVTAVQGLLCLQRLGHIHRVRGQEAPWRWHVRDMMGYC